jgi:hypothetical protein
VASAGWALAFDALTFLVSGTALALMRIPAATRGHAATTVRHEFRDGWREVRSRQWLWVSIVYWGVFNIAAFPAFLVLGPYVAKHSLGGATAWATILTAGGVGSLVSVAVSLRVMPSRPLLACIATTLPWWAPVALLAAHAPTALIATAFFVTSVAIGWGNTLWTTTLQRQIPPEAISRVSSFDLLGTYVVAPLGYALVGAIAAGIGVTETLAGAAALGTLVTLVTLSVGSIRSVQRLDPAPAD